MSDLQPIDPEAAVDLYLEERAGEVADETLKSHKYRLAEFVNWCEENDFTNMNEIDGRDLHAFRVARREDGLKPVSLRGQLSTLREFLRFCVSIEAVPDGLPEKVLLPTVSGRERPVKRSWIRSVPTTSSITSRSTSTRVGITS